MSDSNPYGVKAGQVWRSMDPRDNRMITVLQVGVDKAQVQGFVKSWISLKRFRPNSTGYRLVKG